MLLHLMSHTDVHFCFLTLTFPDSLLCVCVWGGGFWTTSRRTATFFRETFPKTFNINTISFSSISPVARPMDRNKSHKKLLVLLYSNPCQKVSQIHLRRRTFLPTAPPSGAIVMVTNHKTSQELQMLSRSLSVY